jgi:hypothetical protein
MRTLAGSRASLSPSRSSPIELLALYAPPRERVRRAVSALDEGKDLQPQSARNEYVEKGGDSATSSAGGSRASRGIDDADPSGCPQASSKYVRGAHMTSLGDLT